MAVRDIRTRLSIDGEKEFKDALSDAGRSMRVLDSELKNAKASFEQAGDEMIFLGSKSRILNNQIAQQRNIVAALENAVKDSADAYGDSSAKTDGYRIKLNNARAALSKMEKELKDTDAELLDLGRDSGRVGRQLESGITDAAEDAGDKLDSMVNQINQSLGGIGGATSISAFVDVGSAVVSVASTVYDALQSVTEETEEYRRQMAGLGANAMLAGYDPEMIKSLTFDVAALTGDLDGAVEGMNNLMAAGLDEGQLRRAVALLSGAAVRWNETLKFESLSDSLQESIASGSSTGQFDELLSRLGLDMEQVRLSFEEAAKVGEGAVKTAALAWLESGDLEGTTETYKELAGALIEAEAAQLRWNDEMARTGEILQPVMTDITNFKTSVLSIFNDILSGSETIGEESAEAFWDSYNRKMQKDPDKGFTLFDWEAFFTPETWTNITDFAGRALDSTIDFASKNIIPIREPEVLTAQDEYLFYALGEEEYAKFKAQGETAGAEIVAGFDEAITESGETAESDMEIVGENLGTSVANGLAEQSAELSRVANEQMDMLNQIYSQPIAAPSLYVPYTPGVTGTGDPGGVKTREVSLILDGNRLGRTAGSYIDTELGVSATRTERYG